MSELILGGDVNTMITYIITEKSTDENYMEKIRQKAFREGIAAEREAQEEMCGYKLMLTKSRETRLDDQRGEVHEVFITFSPYPTAELEPQLAPPAPADMTKA